VLESEIRLVSRIDDGKRYRVLVSLRKAWRLDVGRLRFFLLRYDSMVYLDLGNVWYRHRKIDVHLSCVCASDFQGSLILAALLATLHPRMLGQILILQ